MKNIKNSIKKIIYLIQNIIYRHEKIKEPLLYMTILAKDESDIIEQQIVFHKMMGIDGFIVTDNNSSDSTLSIFKKYYSKGWIKEIIEEPSDEYDQVQWVDRMIKIARDKYNADWIINADADEFWVPNSGNLKSDIIDSSNNILYVDIHNVYPEDNKLFYENTLLIKKEIDISKYDLSPFSIYNKQIPKVMHRAKGYEMIKMGNHSVCMSRPSRKVSNNIEIFHYSLRGYNHFLRKMISGGESVEKALKLKKDVAVHWRYFFNLLKDEKINSYDEYKKTIGYSYYDEFIKLGVLSENKKVTNFFKDYDNE